MEPRNDVVYYNANNNPYLYYYNSNEPAYSNTQSSIRIPEKSYRTTQRPRLTATNKQVRKNPRIKPANRKSTQIRRQFFRPGAGILQRPQQQQQQPVARNALQMSLLLLSILAFGTFATTSIMMGRNNRRNNRREQSTYRVVINKASAMEDKETNTTSPSSTHWASLFTERIFEFITDFVQDFPNLL
ncbi:uncharacterized protein LOC135838485 [Planococcus citri]|uniref:uncharacterized protein LOC135838485 n=1 Tax=Planococcus citri TaxID=170843 RepID=UPI0031F9250D